MRRVAFLTRFRKKNAVVAPAPGRARGAAGTYSKGREGEISVRSISVITRENRASNPPRKPSAFSSEGKPWANVARFATSSMEITGASLASSAPMAASSEGSPS